MDRLRRVGRPCYPVTSSGHQRTPSQTLAASLRAQEVREAQTRHQLPRSTGMQAGERVQLGPRETGCVTADALPCGVPKNARCRPDKSRYARLIDLVRDARRHTSVPQGKLALLRTLVCFQRLLSVVWASWRFIYQRRARLATGVARQTVIFRVNLADPARGHLNCGQQPTKKTCRLRNRVREGKPFTSTTSSSALRATPIEVQIYTALAGHECPCMSNRHPLTKHSAAALATRKRSLAPVVECCTPAHVQPVAAPGALAKYNVNASIQPDWPSCLPTSGSSTWHKLQRVQRHASNSSSHGPRCRVPHARDASVCAGRVSITAVPNERVQHSNAASLGVVRGDARQVIKVQVAVQVLAVQRCLHVVATK